MLSDVVTDLSSSGSLDSEAALACRKAVYADGSGVSADEADALIALNDSAEAASPEWRAMFVEVLTEYLVFQRAPRGYVDQAGADWLIAAVERDGAVKGDTELALLVHVLEAAEAVPEALVAYTLRQAVQAVRAPEAQGAARVDEAEVGVLRRVLYAGGGAAGLGVSRAEAEALFDINDACRGGDNAADWGRLFVQGVASHLLTTSTYRAPDAAEALRRQTWLETPTHLDWMSLFTRPLADTLRLAFERDEDGWRRWQAVDDDAQRAAHAFTTDEQAWLVDRIGRDGVRDVNEQALLDFVLADAALPPPVSVEADVPASPVFGRRQRRAA